MHTSPTGVIRSDVLQQLKGSTLHNGDPHLYLCQIPAYSFSMSGEAEDAVVVNDGGCAAQAKSQHICLLSLAISLCNGRHFVSS